MALDFISIDLLLLPPKSSYPPLRSRKEEAEDDSISEFLSSPFPSFRFIKCDKWKPLSFLVVVVAKLKGED